VQESNLSRLEAKKAQLTESKRPQLECCYEMIVGRNQPVLFPDNMGVNSAGVVVKESI